MLILLLFLSLLSFLKVSHLPYHTVAPRPNQHSARTQSEDLHVWILPRPMLYIDLGTASSILKLFLHFIIISPYTVSTKTETTISIDNIFMTNVVFTTHGILGNSFSSHCSIPNRYTCSMYCVILTEYFFLNTLHIALSHSCILHNGLQYSEAWLNQVRCMILFYAFWLNQDLMQQVVGQLLGV